MINNLTYGYEQNLPFLAIYFHLIPISSAITKTILARIFTLLRLWTVTGVTAMIKTKAMVVKRYRNMFCLIKIHTIELYLVKSIRFYLINSESMYSNDLKIIQLFRRFWSFQLTYEFTHFIPEKKGGYN